MAELVSYNEVKFDPKDYIGDFSELFEDTRYGDLFRFNVEVLHELFQKGEITGSRLLDIGTGPVWYKVYAASRWFGEITLSDISEDNLACLRDWKKGNLGKEDNMIKYILQLDGNSEDLVTASHRVSEKVKHIVQLDVCREPLLVDTEVDGLEFDTILLSLCQFSAAYDYEENLKVVRNYSKYLRRGGYVVLIDAIGVTHYNVGKLTYKNGYVSKDKLLSIFESCGYEIVSWRETYSTNSQTEDLSDNTDEKGAFALVCKKLM